MSTTPSDRSWASASRSPEETWGLLTSYLALNEGYDAFLIECADTPTRVLFRARLKASCEAHNRPFFEPLPEGGIAPDPLAWLALQRAAWSDLRAGGNGLRAVLYLPLLPGDAGRETMRRLNEHRDNLRRELPCALFLVGLSGFLSWVTAEAPDFWSGRTWQCEYFPAAQGASPPDDVAPALEAAPVVRRVHDVALPLPAPGASWPTVAYDTVTPFAYKERFFGRGPEMSALVSALHDVGTVLLVGPGGIGKTRLAAEYAARFASRYEQRVAWLTADRSTRDEAIQALRASVDAAHSPERDVWGLLADRGRTLVVMDGFDDVTAAALLPWLPLRRGLEVIVTARDVVGPSPGLRLDLAPLSDFDAAAMLEARGVGDVLAACDLAAGSPLWLELAAGLDSIGVLSDRALRPRDGEKAEAWLERVVQRAWASLAVDDVAPLVALLLALVSPWTFRPRAVKAASSGRVDVEQAKEHLDATFASLGWAPRGTTGRMEVFVPFHEPVARALLASTRATPTPTRTDAEHLMVQLLVDNLSNSPRQTEPGSSAAITQYWRVGHATLRHVVSASLRATLLLVMSDSHARLGRFAEALQLADDALREAARAQDPALEANASALVERLSASSIAWSPGDDSAPQAASLVLSERERCLGPEHPEVLPPLLNLALAYARGGARTQAEAMLERATQLVLSNHDGNHPAMASVLAARACADDRWGRAASAAIHVAEADRIARATLPEGHPLRRWIEAWHPSAPIAWE